VESKFNRTVVLIRKGKSRGRGVRGMRVWVAQTMHTHVSKCKNNRIKKRKKRKR
jgi:hypothetical protein